MMRGMYRGEELLRQRLAAPLAGMGRAADHPDPELLVAHAVGELPEEEAMEITAHLASCDDGSCAVLLREVSGGAAAARDLLYSRREELTDPSIGAVSDRGGAPATFRRRPCRARWR